MKKFLCLNPCHRYSSMDTIEMISPGTGIEVISLQVKLIMIPFLPPPPPHPHIRRASFDQVNSNISLLLLIIFNVLWPLSEVIKDVFLLQYFFHGLGY